MCKKKKQEAEVIVAMGDTLLVPIDCGMSNLKGLLRLVGEDKFKEFLFGSEVEKGRKCYRSNDIHRRSSMELWRI